MRAASGAEESCAGGEALAELASASTHKIAAWPIRSRSSSRAPPGAWGRPPAEPSRPPTTWSWSAEPTRRSTRSVNDVARRRRRDGRLHHARRGSRQRLRRDQGRRARCRRQHRLRPRRARGRTCGGRTARRTASWRPNFAIGAVLMMEVSKRIAPHMPEVEIIELHGDQQEGRAVGDGQADRGADPRGRRQRPRADPLGAGCRGWSRTRRSSSAARARRSRSATTRSTARASCPASCSPCAGSSICPTASWSGWRTCCAEDLARLDATAQAELVAIGRGEAGGAGGRRDRARGADQPGDQRDHPPALREGRRMLRRRGFPTVPSRACRSCSRISAPGSPGSRCTWGWRR